MNLSLERSEESLLSEDALDTDDDALDTGDDLDASIDGIDTPDETDSLEMNVQGKIQAQRLDANTAHEHEGLTKVFIPLKVYHIYHKATQKAQFI